MIAGEDNEGPVREAPAREAPPGEAEGVRARLESWGFAGEAFLDPRFVKLTEILASLGHVAIAYSGGADSVFLLRVAMGVLRDRAVPVLGFSESLDQQEFEEAKRTAQAMGAAVTVVETREYDNPAYRENDGSRCYHCKAELFREVRRVADSLGIPHVVDGSNADDVGDYRPGFRARDEQQVRSPLLEAGLDKAAIRSLSRALGLPTWDKPAAPCLASRIPHGTPVTAEKLRQIEAAERDLKSLGFRVVRVRHHGQVARVEVPSEDVRRLLEPGLRGEVVKAVKRAGFLFVAVDLEGFRSGSLNEALAKEPGDALAGSPPLVRLETDGQLGKGG